MWPTVATWLAALPLLASPRRATIVLLRRSTHDARIAGSPPDTRGRNARSRAHARLPLARGADRAVTVPILVHREDKLAVLFSDRRRVTRTRGDGRAAHVPLVGTPIRGAREVRVGVETRRLSAGTINACALEVLRKRAHAASFRARRAGGVELRH